MSKKQTCNGCVYVRKDKILSCVLHCDYYSKFIPATHKGCNKHTTDKMIMLGRGLATNKREGVKP